jgi:hypothetical protein
MYERTPVILKTFAGFLWDSQVDCQFQLHHKLQVVLVNIASLTDWVKRFFSDNPTADNP